MSWTSAFLLSVSMSKRLSVADYDPLAKALQPPLDESPEEKISRLAKEEAAKRVSYEIDESIKQERQLQKKKSVVRYAPNTLNLKYSTDKS